MGNFSVLIFKFLVELVLDIDNLDFLLNKLDQNVAINVGPAIKKHDGMIVDGLIKNNVLDLTLCLADNVTQIVIEQKVKLKFDVLVFHELHVISPLNAFLRWDFCDFSVGFGWTVADEDKGVAVENLRVLLIGFDFEIVDGHESVGEGVGDHEIFDVFAGSWGFDLPLLLLFDGLEEDLGGDFFDEFGSFPEDFDASGEFAYSLT